MKTLIYSIIISSNLLILSPSVFSSVRETNDKEGLQLMREEEKLAHDVYLSLYEKWQIPVFNNIASAEERHFNAIGVLLENFNIDDPALTQPGKFKNEKISFLYDSLISRGQESLVAAFEVGAFIEEYDIADLQQLIGNNTDEMINNVYQNLLRGSRNHLRAFTFQLSKQGVYYTPKILQPVNFYTIIESDHERGGTENCAIQQNNGNNQKNRNNQNRNRGNRFRNGRN